MPDEYIDLGSARWAAQSQHDPQVKIVTKHADEMLGGPPAVLNVNLAPTPKFIQDNSSKAMNARLVINVRTPALAITSHARPTGARVP